MRHTNTQAITLDAINVLDLFYINVGFLSLSITLCWGGPPQRQWSLWQNYNRQNFSGHP